MRTPLRCIVPTVAMLFAACGSSDSATEPVTPTPPTGTVTAKLVVTGDPTSTAGATWSYRDTVAGVVYDMAGVLRKPAGAGPFPAVIISHGFGGNARGYSNNVGAEMVQWGLVTMATNYTHASGVSLGSPGLENERGASAANILRGRRVIELLRALGYVDMNRIAAHGHSMGAFLTAGLVGAAPTAFRAASHTAGGVRPVGSGVEPAAPDDAQVATISTPYQMHHGDNDTVVPLSMDQRLSTLFAARNHVHELQVYAGGTHNDVPYSRVMYDRVRAWYRLHGVLP